MNNFLLYISSFIIIFAYVCYFVMIFICSKEKISNDNGFDVSKDIISEYNNINIILVKGYFSVYNIKRRVIKLSNFCYYGNSLSSIGLSLLEAGVSVVDNMKDKYLDMIRNIISNLKILYVLPIISILLNFNTYTINDVRIGIIFIILCVFTTYIIISIKGQVNEWTFNNIKKIDGINKNNSLKIMRFIDKVLWLDKFIFFGELIIIIRFFGILLEIF